MSDYYYIMFMNRIYHHYHLPLSLLRDVLYLGEMSSDLYPLCRCNGTEPEKQERLLTGSELNMTLARETLMSTLSYSCNSITSLEKDLKFVRSFSVWTGLHLPAGFLCIPSERLEYDLSVMSKMLQRRSSCRDSDCVVSPDTFV